MLGLIRNILATLAHWFGCKTFQSQQQLLSWEAATGIPISPKIKALQSRFSLRTAICICRECKGKREVTYYHDPGEYGCPEWLKKICPHCEGSGKRTVTFLVDNTDTCEKCVGTGRYTYKQPTWYDEGEVEIRKEFVSTCIFCDGSTIKNYVIGRDFSGVNALLNIVKAGGETCSECKGSGKVTIKDGYTYLNENTRRMTYREVGCKKCFGGGETTDQSIERLLNYIERNCSVLQCDDDGHGYN